MEKHFLLDISECAFSLQLYYCSNLRVVTLIRLFKNISTWAEFNGSNYTKKRMHRFDEHLEQFTSSIFSVEMRVFQNTFGLRFLTHVEIKISDPLSIKGFSFFELHFLIKYYVPCFVYLMNWWICLLCGLFCFISVFQIISVSMIDCAIVLLCSCVQSHVRQLLVFMSRFKSVNASKP